MIGINVTNDEFESAQERLALFLKKKYNIQAQSPGIMEFGAAFILGYKNHHQLNHLFDDNSIKAQGALGCKVSCDQAIADASTDADLFYYVAMSSQMAGFVADGAFGDDYSMSQVNKFLVENFSNINAMVGEYSLIEKFCALANQSSGFTIRFYNDKESYDKRIGAEELNGFTFYAEIIERLWQTAFLGEEGEASYFYGVRIHDREYEIDDHYTRGELQAKLVKYKSTRQIMGLFLTSGYQTLN